jgi:hypothetical protein
VVISGSTDRTVRVWDSVAGGQHDQSQVGPADQEHKLPIYIDLASGVTSLAVINNGQLVGGTELGFVCLRFPG